MAARLNSQWLLVKYPEFIQLLFIWQHFEASLLTSLLTSFFSLILNVLLEMCNRATSRKLYSYLRVESDKNVPHVRYFL